MAFPSPRLSVSLPALLMIVPTFPLQLSLSFLVLCLTPLPVTSAAVTISLFHDDPVDRDSLVTLVSRGNNQKCWEECVGEGGDADYCEEICWLKGSKTVYGQGFPTKRSGFYDGGYDEDACWEECTGKEGADADYCEEICRNHDHGGEGEGSNGGDNKETKVGILMQTVQSQGRDDEDACWEECTSKEGADAEYCEEICRNHDHDKRPDDGNDDDIVGVTTKNFWKPDRIDDPSEDEDACWEDCTSKEGADADYCEEICRNHDHGNDDNEDGGEDLIASFLQTVLQDPISSLHGNG